MSQIHVPRLVVAGLAGDTGKSLVSLGLVRALRTRGLAVSPFKKGPDFIDAAWLGAAADVPGRNLDTFLMHRDAIMASLKKASAGTDIAVIEGNRGLYDGMDAVGSHSTAELAKLIGAPVLLVVNATKTTRTVAALVKGCQVLDPNVPIVGVVLNRIGTKRQEKVIREAIRRETGLPVVGAIPKLDAQHLPSRHLGLVTAMEHGDLQSALGAIEGAVMQHVDVAAVLALANSASGVADANDVYNDLVKTRTPPASNGPKPRVRIGVLRDEAFSFYYPENLEALEASGAELQSISPVRDHTLPHIDALYAGGGFPEVHAEKLSANQPLRGAIKKRVAEGLPVWAECGGLMYLAASLLQAGTPYPMVGALPIAVEQQRRPQGHGYVQATVDRKNPFLDPGTALKGHEFHYSRLKASAEQLPTVLELERGTGIGGGRDGICQGNVVAMYTHLHALGTPEWAPGMVRACTGAT
ncbi:MAG: cobyrinate a,c-diamide synthase [Myxococcota bacterium]|nr:cobyrinate a,c-diamide synthase [Myxococcota bacterium]